MPPHGLDSLFPGEPKIIFEVCANAEVNSFPPSYAVLGALCGACNKPGDDGSSLLCIEKYRTPKMHSAKVRGD